MSNIPQARAELEAIAEELKEIGRSYFANEILAVIENHMTRTKPVRKAGNQSTPMTDELRDNIKHYAARYPRATFAAIAVEFNVNPGRVSEALAR